MTLLRHRLLKKICMYQYGISGNIKYQFIDLFDKISLELLNEHQLDLINKTQLHIKNIYYLNNIFYPLLCKFENNDEYYTKRYNIEQHDIIDILMLLPLCDLITNNTIIYPGECCSKYDDIFDELYCLKEIKVLIKIIEILYNIDPY
jgi:hypothetical protein